MTESKSKRRIMSEKEVKALMDAVRKQALPQINKRDNQRRASLGLLDHIRF